MADENISDLEYIQRRFDALQRELREALQTMELRDDQRGASHQALVGTLTSQMVSVGTQVDELLNLRLGSTRNWRRSKHGSLTGSHRAARADRYVQYLQARLEGRGQRRARALRGCIPR